MTDIRSFHEEMTKRTPFLILNREREVVKSLEVFRFMLGKTEEDLYYWKWVIITLHQALQATIFLSIIRVPSYFRGSNHMFLEEWCDWLEPFYSGIIKEEIDEYGFPVEVEYEPRLDSLIGLYKRMKKYLGYHPPYEDTLVWLDRYRNQFVHLV